MSKRDRIKRQLARLGIERRQLAIERQELELEEELARLDSENVGQPEVGVVVDLTTDENKTEVKEKTIDEVEEATQENRPLQLKRTGVDLGVRRSSTASLKQEQLIVAIPEHDCQGPAEKVPTCSGEYDAASPSNRKE